MPRPGRPRSMRSAPRVVVEVLQVAQVRDRRAGVGVQARGAVRRYLQPARGRDGRRARPLGEAAAAGRVDLLALGVPTSAHPAAQTWRGRRRIWREGCGVAARERIGGGGRGSGPVMKVTDMAPRVLREYAFVADGERGALIGPTARWHGYAFPAGIPRPRSAGCSAARAGTRSPQRTRGMSGAGTTRTVPSSGAAGGSAHRGLSAGKRWPCRPTRTGRCCCAASRPWTGRPRSPSSWTCAAGTAGA